MTGTHLKGPSSVDNELTTARELNKTTQKKWIFLEPENVTVALAPFTRTLHFSA